MKKILLIGLIVAMILSLNAVAQDAAAVIAESAKAMGATALQSIQYSGTGTNNSVGQAASGGPWPRFKVTKYVASVNYAVPAMRQEIVRIEAAHSG